MFHELDIIPDTAWGGSVSGWLRIDDESASKVVFNAQNSPPTPERGGSLIIFFKRDSSSPSIGTVSLLNKICNLLILTNASYSSLVSTKHVLRTIII